MPIDITDALIGLGGIGIGALGTYLATKKTNDTNLTIAREKVTAENKLEMEASQTIRQLLSLADWKLRSFETIKKQVRGFDDNELRKLLVSSGAVSFDQRDTGKELWGLRDRNSADLGPAPGALKLAPELPAPNDGPIPPPFDLPPAGAIPRDPKS